MKAYPDDLKIGYTIRLEDEEWIVDAFQDGQIRLVNEYRDYARWVSEDQAPFTVVRL